MVQPNTYNIVESKFFYILIQKKSLLPELSRRELLKYVLRDEFTARY